MSETEGRRWCFGKMDLAVTGPCRGCPDIDACYEISFKGYDGSVDEP